MGQCVSRKAGAVIAASGYSPSYRIMEKKPSKHQGDNKNAAKRGAPHTRGTAISFGFRRRGGPPLAREDHHQRSKSLGPEHEARRREAAERQQQYSSSGRSTPRLAPPKKEASGLPIRTNRFGFRSQQPRLTDKVADLSLAGTGTEEARRRQPRPSPVKQPAYGKPVSTNLDQSRGRFTLHTSHLPLPQYAVRMSEPNSKGAKTAANQSRKVGAGACSSKEGSGTEDSGLGCSDDATRRPRPRRLGLALQGKGFDVWDVDDENTVTEISVIPLPRNFAQQQLQRAGPAAPGLVRERASQYQRALAAMNKDNRYCDSTTSMSTTSSEGYDEGLGEEKAYQDRSRSEKGFPGAGSDAGLTSPPSSDEQEFGLHGGEAMADEYSFASSEECAPAALPRPILQGQTTRDHFRAISNAAKSGALPKSALRSVLLTIEDPAFAAVAATTTTLIDDETSPVDSLFDSPTASLSHSEVMKPGRREAPAIERSTVTGDDDSPGTPTNASNSLSLSEGREFFDDDFVDQPGLVFDDTLRESSAANTDHSLTVLETVPKINGLQGKSVENSPMNGRKINRAGSVSTLSSCESLASDDLMMDYERSDASSFGDVNSRGNSTYVMQDLDDATSLLELEIQGHEVMKEWNSILGQSQQALNNSTNNNINISLNNNQNMDSGLNNTTRTTRLLHNRSNAESPRSLDSTRGRQVFSPLRPPRNVQSPSLDSGDEGSLRLERGTYSYMFQDIVSIKTMLLKLKRVLQESETLNPFDNSLKNGLFYNLNDGSATADSTTSPGDVRDSVADELADLRRQVVFLQGQADDKDRTIQCLQAQLAKLQSAGGAEAAGDPTPNGHLETSNAATQTEKLRPVSAGPSILQELPQNNGMGPLVSWSDSWPSQQQQQQQQPEGSGVAGKPRLPPRRPSDSPRPTSSLRTAGPRLGQASPPESPKAAPGPRSSIPTPRRLAAPTLIPRSARLLSPNGRAHNS